METFKVRIEGDSPLLMHFDNLVFQEILKKWQKDPANQKASVAGDDRSPAWSWLGYLYQDGGKVVLPADNIMTTLREGGAKVPTGKKGATFKRQTQSGLLVNEVAWPVLVNGKGIDARALSDALHAELDFEKHQQAVAAAGFELFVKRARIGQAKHVRVRPRFDQWAAEGTITVLDDQITKQTLETILKHSGFYCGVCDWRPSSPKSPGQFGRFHATVV